MTQLVLAEAGLGRRSAAFIIDFLISGIGAQLSVKYFIEPYIPSDYDFLAWFIFVALIFPLLYWVLLPYFFGATPAKKVLGLRIVMADSQEPPSFWRLALRELVARFISGIVIGLGYVWALFRKDRRSWHDLMAGTRVVRVAHS